MNEMIALGLKAKNDEAVASSRVIAEKFDKRHDNVIRDIEKLIEGIPKIEETPVHRYFIKTNYIHEQNKQRYKEYLMTRDGFTLLAMGFTGAKALKWKLKYIKAFNRMEKFIREKLSSEWQETRIKGKLARRNETDVIMTRLIPLAELQGSKNAGKLYMTYSKLVNKCVGIPANSRDKATRRTLDVIFNLENLIEHVIDEEVEKGTYYKDIYQICKAKCKLLVELSYLPEQKMIA
ncbi:Rha family transcriptional regulator [Anaerophilus nitritogenes]|uniref:Rha family transcriptional regulator n=1 Tax=Anaerophilus nitritogenes TaxID=2498136 RepID=UPI00101D3EB3|nr:Rha family transcriptional regulator [Anaerophilus nitritogenes]